MSTSPHEGVYLYDPGGIAADRFCDTAIIRDGVVGSALHKADSAAQPRCAWVAPSAALWTVDSDPFLVPIPHSYGTGGLLLADRWYTFPLRGNYTPKIRASGSGYRLRIWLAGRSSAGHDCDFAIVVAPQFYRFGRGYAYDDVYEAWPSKPYSNVTSTTVAALTPDDGLRYLDVTRQVVDEALAADTWSTLTDTGGTPMAIRTASLEIVVIARTANITSTPELHGLSVAEVIGT